MANLFKSDYYGNYKQMIRELNGFLATPVSDFRHVDRLTFREDLNRGDRKEIYLAISNMLRSAGKGRSVMERRYSQNDLFLWLTAPKHSNLGENFQSLKSKVYQ